MLQRSGLCGEQVGRADAEHQQRLDTRLHVAGIFSLGAGLHQLRGRRRSCAWYAQRRCGGSKCGVRGRLQYLTASRWDGWASRFLRLTGVLQGPLAVRRERGDRQKREEEKGEGSECSMPDGPVVWAEFLNVLIQSLGRIGAVCERSPESLGAVWGFAGPWSSQRCTAYSLRVEQAHDGALTSDE